MDYAGRSVRFVFVYSALIFFATTANDARIIVCSCTKLFLEVAVAPVLELPPGVTTAPSASPTAYPPKYTNATFSTTYSSIVLKFDAGTNMAGHSVGLTFPCTGLVNVTETSCYQCVNLCTFVFFPPSSSSSLVTWRGEERTRRRRNTGILSPRTIY